jgi:phosphatidylserine/phosphatidylglycerophosphate/cardiolipin synthase-like enzyme
MAAIGLLLVTAAWIAEHPSHRIAGPPGPADTDHLELVETAPVETTLDAEDLRPAHEVWVERIDAATESIELSHFYASDAPAGPDGRFTRTRLTPVLEALERAAARGVSVRILLSERFRETYPEPAGSLAARDGIELRWLDLAPLTGGVQHAKYAIFDRRAVFVGSQNFDWRALEHIQELGVLADVEPVARQFLSIFEFDWALASGAPTDDLRWDSEPSVTVAGARVTPVFSPATLLPPGLEWDLPHLLRLIDAAEFELRVSLLSYSPTDRDGSWFGDLDSALRRAAARGVRVRLLLSDWVKRPGRVEWIQSLEPVPGLEVRLVSLPPASSGHIPFARCVHAKYLAADGDAAWIGTSNWSGDYFHESRNAGLIVEGGALPARLSRFHAATWDSPYALPVDPGAVYTPPRIGE